MILKQSRAFFRLELILRSGRFLEKKNRLNFSNIYFILHLKNLCFLSLKKEGKTLISNQYLTKNSKKK